MFVKCPESKLSEAEDVRCDDFLGGEGLRFFSFLFGDLAFLGVDRVPGDLSGVVLFLLSGDLVRLIGDLLFLRSDDLRGERLLDTLFLFNDGDSLLPLETGEYLAPLSLLLLGGETLLFGDLLLDFKSLFLFVAELLLPVDLLLDLLDCSLRCLDLFPLSRELLLVRRRRFESLSLLLLLDRLDGFCFSEVSLLLLLLSLLFFFSSLSMKQQNKNVVISKDAYKCMAGFYPGI